MDIGIAADSKIINRKIAYGTKNMAKEPAMTRQEVKKALEVGIAMAEELKEKGYGIIATGEMGIGNTTTSSAVTSVLLEGAPAKVTGRGAGLTSAGLEKKIEVIRKAIQLHQAGERGCAGCAVESGRTGYRRDGRDFLSEAQLWGFPWWQTGSFPAWCPAVR